MNLQEFCNLTSSNIFIKNLIYGREHIVSRICEFDREYVCKCQVIVEAHLRHEGNLQLIPEGGNGQFNVERNYYEYFAEVASIKSTQTQRGGHYGYYETKTLYFHVQIFEYLLNYKVFNSNFGGLSKLRRSQHEKLKPINST